MEIINEKKDAPKPLSYHELVLGEVYKFDGADVYVFKVDLGSSGTRLVYLKSGTVVNCPQHYKYWPVTAKLIVS
jgi:hypothetical protein